MVSVTVLISGSGLNLQALIDAWENGVLNPAAELTRVISSSASAYGLERAAKAKIPTEVIQLKDYYKGTPKENTSRRKELREQFNLDLADMILKQPTDLVVCAGWMLILGPTVLSKLAEKDIDIINLHPALPGAFDGTHSIERAWQAGQDGLITKAGVMVHRVIAEVDQGEPILVRELDLLKDELCDEYETRVHKLEHVAIVEATNIMIEERLDKIQNSDKSCKDIRAEQQDLKEGRNAEHTIDLKTLEEALPTKK